MLALKRNFFKIYISAKLNCTCIHFQICNSALFIILLKTFQLTKIILNIGTGKTFNIRRVFKRGKNKTHITTYQDSMPGKQTSADLRKSQD